MPDVFDFKESDPKARRRAVEDSLSDNPRPSRAQLSAMADYMLFVSDPGSTTAERREEYPLLTRNRQSTIAKREVQAESVSADGMSSEDTLSALSSDMPSTALGVRRGELPELDDWRMRENAEAARSLSRQAESATGKRRFELKRQVISKYREKTAIRESVSPAIPPVPRSVLPPDAPGLLDDDVVLDPATQMPRGRRGLTMCDMPMVRALLDDYAQLKVLSQGDSRSDVAALLADLEESLDAVFCDDPVMAEFVRLKLGGMSDGDACDVMAERTGVHRSERYWESRWRVNVPRAVCTRAQRLWLLRHWGKWKVCTMCGRALPAHPAWFTRNTSKDGFYSRCKDCRTKTRKGLVDDADAE